MKSKIERNELMVASYRLGASIREVAHDFGLDGRTARDIIRRWEDNHGVRVLRLPGKQARGEVVRREYHVEYWRQNKQAIVLARKLGIKVREARRMFK